MSKEEKEAKKKKKKVSQKENDEPEVFENDDQLIDSLMVDMNSEFGEGTMLLEGATAGQVTAWVPSGSPVLDDRLGGGWPAGRVVEIFGPESNGKTTVALHAIAETQKMGGIGVFLDTEHALDKRRAKAIGVDLKRLVYAQPGTMEQLFEYVESMVQKLAQKAPDKLITIVWDSVASTPTEKELEGDYGETGFLDHSRIMSQAFRKITKIISKHKVLFICINQIRDKIGVTFGDKTATFGGRALKFYATIRLDVRRVATYKEKEVVKGISCEATVKKNKVAPPFGVAKFNILFREEFGGIDPFVSLLEDGFEKGMFGKSKGWFDIGGKNYRKEDAVELLEGDEELWKTMVDTYLSLA
jgi:recombination protein RecA